MKTGHMDYSGMIDRAMRQVVRDSLLFIQRDGMPGDHHFYVSFSTRHPGVRISESLRAKYPEEMTIVLQHQFWDLKIEDYQFSVMLSFSNIPEKLVIPFSALTAFADPSVKFGLQFHAEIDTQNNMPLGQKDKIETRAPVAPENATDEDSTEDGGDKVITLDKFRKK
jgi:hypothetical protein